MKTVKKSLVRNETELPAGYPRLWFSVYNNSIKIMNLRSKVLKRISNNIKKQKMENIVIENKY